MENASYSVGIQLKKKKKKKKIIINNCTVFSHTCVPIYLFHRATLIPMVFVVCARWPKLTAQ